LNVFEEVKTCISADTVIRDAGVKIGRNGMACCPFHTDKHPSMKVDGNHYHCFGCGAHGDAIGFVAQYYGLSQYDAACKIIEDYHLPIETDHRISDEERAEFFRRKKRVNHVISVKNKFDKWVDDKISELKECETLIEKARMTFIGKMPGEVFISNGFAYMLHYEAIIGYWLDILCMGEDEDKRILFLRDREEVSRIAAGIRRAGNEILGEHRKCAG